MSWLLYKKDGYGSRLEWIRHETAQAMVVAGRAKYALGIYYEILETIPVNTTPPSISGTTKVGQELTCNPGEWDDPTLIFFYQWQGNGVDITDAVGEIFTLTSAQLGQTVGCVVRARNSAGTTPATAPAVGPITAADAPPANTAVPTISGTAQVGQTLTANKGTWSGSPTPTYTYQWMLEGADIAGATGTTYVPVAGDVGLTISVEVTATNSSGNASATSAPTVAVIA